MRRRMAPSAWVWLLVGALYFLIPLAATLEFSLRAGPYLSSTHNFSHYGEIIHDPQFRTTILLSFRMALETIVISLILFIPTVYWVHLKLPRLRPVLAFVALLTFVVPPIVLVVGLAKFWNPMAPNFPAGRWFIGQPYGILVAGYVVLSFPYVYFALDAGFRAIDLHTLTEASQSLGAGWRTTLGRVILPNIRAATLSGAFLTFAIVMGEFTMANILLFNTFPIYINYIGETKAFSAAALSAMSFGLTWLAMLGILFVGRGPGRRQAQFVGTQ